jgi:hypothetical protein
MRLLSVLAKQRTIRTCFMKKHKFRNPNWTIFWIRKILLFMKILRKLKSIVMKKRILTNKFKIYFIWNQFILRTIGLPVLITHQSNVKNNIRKKMFCKLNTVKESRFRKLSQKWRSKFAHKIRLKLKNKLGKMYLSKLLLSTTMKLTFTKMKMKHKFRKS